jgi:hypothetical protein
MSPFGRRPKICCWTLLLCELLTDNEEWIVGKLFSPLYTDLGLKSFLNFARRSQFPNISQSSFHWYVISYFSFQVEIIRVSLWLRNVLCPALKGQRFLYTGFELEMSSVLLMSFLSHCSTKQRLTCNTPVSLDVASIVSSIIL